MSLLERIKTHYAETVAIQELLEKIESYYDAPYEEMYYYYKAMKQKSAEKFIEGWVAYQTGCKKKDSDSYDKKNDDDGLDLGDLVAGDKLVPGVNNIELKVSFETDSIGGGQLRFYEDVAGYLFMKAWTPTKVEFFYLTKNELINEIHTRAVTPYKKDKQGNDKFYTALGSSQGSGKIKGDNQARLQILQENLDKKRQDQIGWNFSAKTEPELYKSWQAKYMKTAKELKEIFKKMSDAI
jgi:hypothetical protein